MEISTIDRDVIANLKDLGGPEYQSLLIELVTIYVTETDKLMERLDGALKELDYDELSKVSHRLKSSSANLGALALGEMCAVLEIQSRSKEVDDPHGQVHQIKDCYRKVRSDLETIQTLLEEGKDPLVYL